MPGMMGNTAAQTAAPTANPVSNPLLALLQGGYGPAISAGSSQTPGPGSADPKVNPNAKFNGFSSLLGGYAPAFSQLIAGIGSGGGGNFNPTSAQQSAPGMSPAAKSWILQALQKQATPGTPTFGTFQQPQTQAQSLLSAAGPSATPQQIPLLAPQQTPTVQTPANSGGWQPGGQAASGQQFSVNPTTQTSAAAQPNGWSVTNGVGNGGAQTSYGGNGFSMQAPVIGTGGIAAGTAAQQLQNQQYNSMMQLLNRGVSPQQAWQTIGGGAAMPSWMQLK